MKKSFVIVVILLTLIVITALAVPFHHLPPKVATSSPKPSEAHITYDHAVKTGMRHIASIVYLDSSGLPDGTISRLKAEHVDTVYLYVAETNDVWFPIGSNPYHLVTPRDVLSDAVLRLHDQGYRVIACVSSALLDPKQTPPAGLSLLQPGTDLIDPSTSGLVLLPLVKRLVTYPVDGVYVGEPYQKDAAIESQQQLAAWNTLYTQLATIVHGAHKSFIMVLPDLYAYGITLQDLSGLPTDFVKLPFDEIGIDMEDTDENQILGDIIRFRAACARVRKLDPQNGIIEINLQKEYNGLPEDPTYIQRELNIARNSGVQTILLFADEFWPKFSTTQQQQLSKELASFIMK